MNPGNSPGKIKFAEQSGTFVLKFVGEVRLTLCSALDATIEKIFAALNFTASIIDLTEAQSVDSTTLGLMAKLSMANPILHMVNAFRYGILGFSDINIGWAMASMLVAAAVLYGVCISLLKSGRGMRQ